MSLAGICAKNNEIERRESCGLSTQEFLQSYFQKSRPVVITGATDGWPARQWTIPSLVERVGQNEVWVRGKTNLEDYRSGKTYTIRKDTFGQYCADLLKGNARSRCSYLAVASMQNTFPQLLDEVPFPDYLSCNGKLHLGPYMWVAAKGHYEFCHFDPDDNFLIMVQGRKQVRLFGHDLESLYPNPLGSYGKTIQSNVNCDAPDLAKHPNFANAHCQYTILHPGEMLFIPAFYWHQVSALDSGISLNMFYGDNGECNYVQKILRSPYQPHFEHWILNIIEQNRSFESFSRILARLPEVVEHFFHKQWHDKPTEDQVDRVVTLIKNYCQLKELPQQTENSKFPPVLKIRGLLFRDGSKK